jgi:hypothetical protein
MPRHRKYLLIALTLQLVMVLAGQVSDTILGLSGLFGMGIPLVVAWIYAARRALSFRDASAGGMAIGAVGAAIALVVAIALNGGSWSLLPLGTLASTATGWLGAFLGWMRKGRKEHAPE